MKFHIDNEDLKTYIKLSYYALSVIEGDMSALANGNAKSSKSAFLNDLMLNYGFEQEYVKLRTLKEQAKLYEKEASDHFNIRIKKETRVKLETINSEIVELYENSIGSYVKTIAEVYSRLPYYEREQVWYRERVYEIEESIGRFALKISTTRINQEDKPHIVIPYKIEHDKWTGYNYLIGIEQDTGNTCCFRVAFINCIKRLQSEKITKDNIKKIETEKKKRGLQFLSEPTEKIKASLTANGQKMYAQILYMRPQYREKDNCIYCFDCTPRQFEYYFLKFGKDVEVLEPLALREKFIGFYKEAAKIYSTE
ncbi:MAG: WYL domain-containing protein [Oscillospiraceae bacterium]|nr:WYL domain-containing protein [Oscillospiraceae bacterium]